MAIFSYRRLIKTRQQKVQKVTAHLNLKINSLKIQNITGVEIKN